ncbi:MAG: imidazole glycerol phosphate synthase subunit HisH [Fibrobacteres bacterium]|nr:imidazole glycerol phosphate synthase subunit HisH [Fibrobacterota bacterium]
MIVIVDYDAGNLTSVKRALDFLEIDSKITPDPKQIIEAERVIFPGVGHASTAMDILRNRGIDTALREVFRKGTPLMGICLGTQIILSESEEGKTSCLGLLDGLCPKFSLKNSALKVPHMGWDSIRFVRPHPVLEGVLPTDEFYFVHSYFPQPADMRDVIGFCEYEIDFPAVIGRNNLFATQFHPEKSGQAGLRILKNFSTWDGKL